jgi:lipopolysaccharide export system permease protein
MSEYGHLPPLSQYPSESVVAAQYKTSFSDYFKSFRQIYFFYFLAQIIPIFLMGLAIFLAIIMMMQFLQISEFLLIHNVGAANIGRICLYMCISFLPIILPMSLLFAVLLTYARMSADSEVIAFKSLGYSLTKLALPAVAFSIFISLLSGQALFFIGPSARANLDLLTTNIGNQKIMSSIQQGTFSESFFDLVLYTNRVDEKKNIMEDVFIYDGRNDKHPVVIVAKTGSIRSNASIDNQSAQIVLRNGTMTNLEGTSNTMLHFEDYALTISSEVENITASKDANTYTYFDIVRHLKKRDLTDTQLIELRVEFIQRFATMATCLLFGFLGASLGSSINRRSGSSIGFIMSIVCVVVYFLMYTTVRSIATKSSMNPMLILWVPNFLFFVFTAWSWRRAQ